MSGRSKSLKSVISDSIHSNRSDGTQLAPILFENKSFEYGLVLSGDAFFKKALVSGHLIKPSRRAMSNKGIYTALSGAMAQSQRMDTIANNIANVNTNAFKKDKQTFYEYLSANEKMPDVIKVPRVPASTESFYDMQGGDRGYVDSNGTYTDHSQGTLKPTNNPFDMAISGAGFFEVLTPQGPRLTRSGNFKVNSQGQLVNLSGHPVLLAGTGQDPQDRTINLNSKNLTVSYTGDIYEGGEFLGRISLVNPTDMEALQKVGSSYYKLKNNFPQQLVPAPGAQVRQGFLEGSNVNIIKEMTDMISATRTFESAQKAIKAFDQMNGKLVNEVPKL